MISLMDIHILFWFCRKLKVLIWSISIYISVFPQISKFKIYFQGYLCTTGESRAQCPAHQGTTGAVLANWEHGRRRHRRDTRQPELCGCLEVAAAAVAVGGWVGEGVGLHALCGV